MLTFHSKHKLNDRYKAKSTQLSKLCAFIKSVMKLKVVKLNFLQ